MIRARGSEWWLSATLLSTSGLMRKPPGREMQPQPAALRANYDDRYITVVSQAVPRPIIALVRRYEPPPHPCVHCYQATKNRSDGFRSTNESFSTQPSRPHTCPAR